MYLGLTRNFPTATTTLLDAANKEEMLLTLRMFWAVDRKEENESRRKNPRQKFR